MSEAEATAPTEAAAESKGRIRDKAAFGLLIAMLLATTGSIGATLGAVGTGNLQDLVRLITPERHAASDIEDEQRRQALAIERLEMSVRTVTGDVAALEAMNLSLTRTAASASVPARPAEDERVTRALVDIGALRASIDANDNALRKDVAAIGQRVDRLESLLMSREATASIGPRAVEAAAEPAKPQAPARRRGHRTMLSGWTIESAEAGSAIITHSAGTFIATPGATLPGLGRVSAVRQRGERWTVVTSRGVIAQQVQRSPQTSAR